MFISAAAYTLYSIETRISPLVRDMTLSALSSRVTDACNVSVLSLINSNENAYDNIIDRAYGTDGSLKSVSVNYKNLTEFKSELAVDVQNRINDIDDVTISIPFMAMFTDYFYGSVGFPIKIKALTDENVAVDLVDEFESVGINQTRHTIMVRITAEVGVNLPIRDSGDDIVTDVPIAETIISGDVPRNRIEYSDDLSD